MSYFTQSGDVFSPTPGRESLLDSLPVGNYIVIETMSGLMFKRVDSFQEPGRMYGNINDRADRILNTFEDRPRTTGVLLHGEKGSGKSQLARNVSFEGYKRGYPTILVNAPFHGDAFNALLATIEQPAIIVFDEFEKVYGNDELQEQVLTLLDGVMTSKKLFVLTVNDSYRVNHHMKNRPGRLFYSIEFGGLEAEFVKEYCKDSLDNQSQIDSVLKISGLFKAFNFDMLKALVEEMNRYKETAFEAMELLNAKPFGTSDTTKYEVVVTSPEGVKSQVAEAADLPMANHHGQMGMFVVFDQDIPLPKNEFDKFLTELGIDPEEVEDEESFSYHLIVHTKGLKKVDMDTGVYEFEDDKGFRATFTKKKDPGFSMQSLAYAGYID